MPYHHSVVGLFTPVLFSDSFIRAGTLERECVIARSLQDLALYVPPDVLERININIHLPGHVRKWPEIGPPDKA